MMPGLCWVVGNLAVTSVLTKNGRYLPEVTIAKNDCRAHLSTYRPAVITKDRRNARPALATMPGTDRTIGCQGPAVWTGRLGTLFILYPVFRLPPPCPAVPLIKLYHLRGLIVLHKGWVAVVSVQGQVQTTSCSRIWHEALCTGSPTRGAFWGTRQLRILI